MFNNRFFLLRAITANFAKLSFVCVIFLWSAVVPYVAFANTGVPKILNYQGRLMDGAGVLLGGGGTDYCFKFSLFDNPTVGSGTKLWPTAAPSQMTVNVKNGIFSVGIGDTNAGGDSLDYNFQDSDAIYLNVDVASKTGGVCGTFETLSPRQRIYSSGYAVNASTLGGYSPSQTPTGNNIPVLNNGDLQMAGGISAGNATTTNATTTNIAISGNASTSNLVVSNNFVLGTLTGILKAVGGAVTTALVDLTSDVTGILAVSHGGTGWANVAAGAVLFGNGSNALATTTAGTPGYVLAYLNGVPTWTATSTYAYPLVNTGNTVSLAYGTTTVNTWSGLQTFASGASSTNITASGTVYAQTASTTNFIISSVQYKLLTTDGQGNVTGIATSSLGLLTSDVAEGTNLYFTGNRVASVIAGTTTDALKEGTNNLYYSDTRARSALSALFPILYNTGVGQFSLGFGTTTDNTWAGTQTYTNLVAGNATIGTLTATTSALLASTTAEGTFITGNIIATSTATSSISGPLRVGTTSSNYLVSVVGSTTSTAGNVGSAVMSITNTNPFLSSGTNVLRLNVGVPAASNCNTSTTCPQFIEFFAGANGDNGGTGLGSIRTTTNGTGVSLTSGAADLAEYMQLSESASPGDIVSLNSSGQYQRAVAGQSLVGVVSNNAGFVGNGTIEGQTNAYVIGFAGVVQTTVSTANGTINAGDLITAGSSPGVGVKLVNSGYAIGQALVGYSGAGNGSINVLVFPKYVDAAVALQSYGGSSGGESGYWSLATSTGVLSPASTTYTTIYTPNATFTAATTTFFAVTGNATSTFRNGINLNSGCYAIAGNCLPNFNGTAASSTILSDNNTFSGSNTFTQTINGSITGNAGTLDNQNGAYYIANSFSTTSADTWKGQRNFFSTSSADYHFALSLAATTTDTLKEGINNLYYTDSRARGALSALYPLVYSTGSGQFSIAFGTTTNNTWSGTQTFTNGISISTYNGLVGANNGTTYQVSTSTLDVGGNAGTATALQNAHTINGISFNGTSNIIITAASSSVLTDNNTFAGANTFTQTIAGDITGNAGTLGNQSGSYYIANSFSTTSADFWKTQRNFFSTTSANYFESTFSRWATSSSDYWLSQRQGAAFSTTSADYHFASAIEASTTVAKTTLPVVWNALQTFQQGLISQASSTLVGWTNLFGGATTTNQTVYGTMWLSPSSINGATTTIQSSTSGTSTIQGFINVTGANSTSTFSGNISVNNINVAGIATSTYTNGVNIASGCFSVEGTCVPTSATLLSTANTWSALQTLQSGLISQSSSTIKSLAVAFGTTTNATSSTFAITSLSNALVAVNGNGSAIAAGIDNSLQFSNNTIALNLSNPNIWSGLQTFGNASTTALSAYNQIAVGKTATTTIVGDGATSTFAGDIRGMNGITTNQYLAVGNNSTTTIAADGATSTFAGGINLTSGCFAINGGCIGYVTKLASIYATSSAGTTTVQFTGAPGSSPSWNAGTLTLPSNITSYSVEGWGGGGGGGAQATNAGAIGSTTCYAQGSIACGGGAQHQLIQATGGGGGAAAGGAVGSGGSAVTNFGGISLNGGNGLTGSIAGTGAGGASPRGGGSAGSAPTGVTGNAGFSPGGGGSGGGTYSGGGSAQGSGGGGGAYSQNFATTSITAASAFTIGRGGQGGVAGTVTGGTGASGGIVITLYATSSATAAGGNDYAEMFPVSSPLIGAGDIVAVDKGVPVSMRLASQGDVLAGVISTQPGQVLGDANAPGERPVAFSGRVPVKVNLENGAIHIGDRITPSSIPGVGMKAGPFDDSVGIALDDFDGTSGETVMMFMDLQRGVDINKVAFGLLGYDPTFFGLGASTSGDSIGALDFVGGLMNAISRRVAGVGGAYTAVDSFATTTAATSTTSSTSTAIDNFASSFLQSIFAAIKQMLADAANGISDIFAGTFHAKNAICVGDQCLNQSDVQELLKITHGSSTDTTQTAAAGTSVITATAAPIPAPEISINGNNPASINVGDTYADLGASITGPSEDLNLGITLIVDGTAADAALIDTSVPGDHTITYRVIDKYGQVTEKTRIVHVLTPMTSQASSSPTTATTTSDTSTTNSTVTTSTTNTTNTTTTNTAISPADTTATSNTTSTDTSPAPTASNTDTTSTTVASTDATTTP